MIALLLAAALVTPSPAPDRPCGYVDFEPLGPSVYDRSGRVTEHIALVVHFNDGHEERVVLDYPWTYPGRAQDPFVPGNANVPALFEFPPDAQRANEPPVVQYVMKYTTPLGYTRLRDCTK